MINKYTFVYLQIYMLSSKIEKIIERKKRSQCVVALQEQPQRKMWH